jgi:hypothetical protein
MEIDGCWAREFRLRFETGINDDNRWFAYTDEKIRSGT